jgi:hypothetical protein
MQCCFRMNKCYWMPILSSLGTKVVLKLERETCVGIRDNICELCPIVEEIYMRIRR